MQGLSRLRLGFREKLAIWIFAVTVIAIAVNYITLVPRLDLALKNDRVKEVNAVTGRYYGTLQSLGPGLPPGQYPQQLPGYFEALTTKAASDTGYRVRVIELDPTQADRPATLRIYEEGSVRQQQVDVKDGVTLEAIRTRRPASGVNQIGETPAAETAIPLVFNGTTTTGVMVFSDSLSNAQAIVDRVSRRILVAGMIALVVALLVGMLAARTLTMRVRRLQRAALDISQGNFTQPLPVDSSDELGELAQAFNTMQDRLGRSDRARKAFIATASHELRTPLFSLGGYMELLRDEDLDAETQREFLETMDMQIRRLQKLATDLLDLSRIDSGTLDIRPEQVRLDDIATAVMREFEPRAVQHDSRLEVHAATDAEAYCDPERVAQVVRILVDNALSHTPAGTDIDLSVNSENGIARLVVADDGPGIPADQLARVFERFHTGERSGGTGLGLSIAREIAGAMQSRLDVTSVPNKTEFTLTLPVDRGKH